MENEKKRGRPCKREDEKSVRIQVSLPKDVFEAYRKESNKLGLKYSQAIANALEKWINNKRKYKEQTLEKLTKGNSRKFMEPRKENIYYKICRLNKDENNKKNKGTNVCHLLYDVLCDFINTNIDNIDDSVNKDEQVDNNTVIKLIKQYLCNELSNANSITYDLLPRFNVMDSLAINYEHRNKKQLEGDFLMFLLTLNRYYPLRDYIGICKYCKRLFFKNRVDQEFHSKYCLKKASNKI